MPNFIEIGGVTRKPLVDLTRNDPIGVVYCCQNVTKPNNETKHNAIREVSKGDSIIMGGINVIHYRAQG